MLSRNYRRIAVASSLFLFLFLFSGVPSANANTIQCFNLDTNPGWTVEGQWQFGVPLGLGGTSFGNPDPTSGATGSNVYGVNLAGDYSTAIGGPYYLKTGPLNLANYKNIKLHFQRWLNTDYQSYVYATIDVSNDGVTWVPVWNNGTGTIADSQWIPCEYDISSVADNHSAVYIRWGHQVASSGAFPYSGWNIDDICLLGDTTDALSITPTEGLDSNGFQGGPFTPSSKNYTLVNTGSISLSWTATKTQPWLNLSSVGGTLAPNESNNFVVSLNSAANSLPPGPYSDVITFTNVTSGFIQTRQVTLNVKTVPGEIVVTDSIAPSGDLNMPFGDVIVGASRTGSITIANTDPLHNLLITDINCRGWYYFEDFNDGLAQNWLPNSPNYWQVVSGEYRASAGTIGTVMQSMYMGDVWKDFSAKVNIRRTGDMYSASAIFFRTTDDFFWGVSGSGYGVGIDGDQVYWVGRFDNGVMTWLTNGWVNSPYLNPDPASNLVTVNIHGSQIEVYFNGNLAWSGSDGIIPGPGRIIIAGYSGGDSETIHYFDDVLVDWPLAGSQGISDAQKWYNDHPCRGGNSQQSPSNCTPPEYPGDAEYINHSGPVPLNSSDGFRLEGVPSLPFSIPPLGSVTVNVIFQPANLRPYPSSVIIASNDSDEPLVTVGLSGTGILDYITVSPTGAKTFSGHPGGPFVPSKITYTLHNTNLTQTMNWSAAKTAPWFDVSPSSGSIAPGGSVLVTAKPNSSARTLPQGVYNDVLVFTNLTTTVQHNCPISLNVFTAPKIWLDPAEGGFNVTVRLGETLKEILTIGDSGDANLAFSLSSQQLPAAPLKADSPVAALAAGDNEMVFEYSFEQPTIEKTGNYDLLKIKGLGMSGQTAAPVMPVRPVEILVPFGKQVVGCSVAAQDVRQLPGFFVLQPAQKPYRLNYRGAVVPTSPDATIYKSSSSWPGGYYRNVSTQSKRGYQVFIVNLYPVQYVPARGAVSYASKLVLTVTLADAGQTPAVMPCDAAKARLTATVDNPAALQSYSAAGETAKSAGSLTLPPGGPYKYIIITNQALKDAPGPNNFQALCNARAAEGLPATIVTTEWIYANYDGTKPSGGSDNQTQIRNFLIDAYQNWQTQYVLLGGSNAVVPARLFYVDSLVGDIDYMPVDMYYACLDPSTCTFDYDADNLYGEPTDGPGGGDVDLLAEIYVGRAPVENAAELASFVKKTLAYNSTDSEYLPRIAMVGEYLGFGGVSDYATASMEQIRTGGNFDGYYTCGFEENNEPGFIDFNTVGNIPGDPTCLWPLYDSPSYTWPTDRLTCLMNSGIHVFNHLGHANETYCMKLYTSDLSSLSNTDYFFTYSQGCYPGAFDTSNCFAEVLTSMEHGAFAVVMNARYGYGMFNSTAGPSQYYARQFWDAPLGEGILEIGRANQDSKEDNISLIGGDCMRWCYYELNLFGDPAQKFRFAQGLDWLLLTPEAGVVPHGGVLDVNVIFSADKFGLGDYFGQIIVSSDDNYNPSITVPVKMTIAPSAFAVSPQDGLSSTGVMGGPFKPASGLYTLTNSGDNSRNWLASANAPWLAVEPNHGALAPGHSQVVKLSFNADALVLEPNLYSAVVTFTDLSIGLDFTRDVNLNVTVPDFFTEMFDYRNNDVNHLTLTLTPDDSGQFYMPCIEEANKFPVDPAGGTVLSLGDDDYAEIALAGGKLIPFYRQYFDVFYVGSNGYITFDTGDVDPAETLEQHFLCQRISALFDDLNPAAGGSVSWKQTADKVVVTFVNVPEYSLSTRNSFQVEMFFDGVIRITWLGIAAKDGLVGLSPGNGIADYFVESDVSRYASCLSGDLNWDGKIDLADWAFFAGYWLENNCSLVNGYCDGCDSIRDGKINFEDFARFADIWLDAP